MPPGGAARSGWRNSSLSPPGKGFFPPPGGGGGGAPPGGGGILPVRRRPPHLDIRLTEMTSVEVIDARALRAGPIWGSSSGLTTPAGLTVIALSPRHAGGGDAKRSPVAHAAGAEAGPGDVVTRALSFALQAGSSIQDLARPPARGDRRSASAGRSRCRASTECAAWCRQGWASPFCPSARSSPIFDATRTGDGAAGRAMGGARAVAGSARHRARSSRRPAALIATLKG